MTDLPGATQSKVQRILDDPDRYAAGKVRGDSATGWARRALIGFIAFHVLAGIAVSTRLMVSSA